jgi:hypothetical protein
MEFLNRLRYIPFQMFNFGFGFLNTRIVVERRLGGQFPIFITGLFLFLAGCSCISKEIPVDGKLGPYTLSTTVDSTSAKYYFEQYLAGKKSDPAFDAKLDSLHKQFETSQPQRDDLKRIAKEFSVDLAALFWAHEVLRDEVNTTVQKIFIDNLEAVRKGATDVQTQDYVLILAPGLDYKENGHLTGADLKTQVELFRKMGVRVQFVEVPPLGTVEECATVIAAAIRNNLDKKIILSGASSAGPAIHLALAKHISPKESEHIVAWLNLGGVVNGSPVIDWMDSGLTYPIWRILLWVKGWNPETFRSLRADISRERASKLKIPGHIKVINYIGLSLSGNISKFAEDKYCIMRSEGPNDGLALLPDMVLPNSSTIIAPTSDHFFAEDPLIKEKSIALLKTVLESL